MFPVKQITESPEPFSRAGGSRGGYIRRVYRDLASESSLQSKYRHFITFVCAYLAPLSGARALWTSVVRVSQWYFKKNGRK